MSRCDTPRYRYHVIRLVAISVVLLSGRARATLYAYKNAYSNSSEPETFDAPLATYGMILGPGDGAPGFLHVALDNSYSHLTMDSLELNSVEKSIEMQSHWRKTKNLDHISFACQPILPAAHIPNSPTNVVSMRKRMQLGTVVQKLTHQSTNRVIQQLYKKACSLLNQCNYNKDIIRRLTNKFALIRRGNCNFDLKTKNAQDAGYQGVIIFDPSSSQPRIMPGTGSYDITIPSVMVGRATAQKLVDTYMYDIKLKNPDREPFVLMVGDSDDIINYLLPFSLIIAVCLTTMLIFSLARVVRQWSRNRKARLTKKKLKKLPKKKYDKETDDWETCAVCLEDYNTGDEVRILPCNHAYHVDCIDPWLTRSRRNCPLCKRSVLSSEDNSDSELNRVDSDLETGSTTTQTVVEQDGEEEPLLHDRSTSRSRNTSLAQRMRLIFSASERSHSREAGRYHDEEMLIDHSDDEAIHAAAAARSSPSDEPRLRRQGATRRRSMVTAAPHENALPSSDDSPRASPSHQSRPTLIRNDSPVSSSDHSTSSDDFLEPAIVNASQQQTSQDVAALDRESMDADDILPAVGHRSGGDNVDSGNQV